MGLPLLMALLLAAGATPPMLASEDPAARAGAYRALAADATPADAGERLEQLAAALASETDPRARGAGQDAMARLPLSEADLVDALSVSPHAVARAWAAHALGHREAAGAVEALLGAVDDPEELVRAKVYEALARSDDPRAISALRKAAVRDPSAALRDAASQAALAAVRHENPDVPGDLALLEAGDPAQRVNAARRLGQSGDWRALQPLLAAARSGPMEVRQAALLALGHLGDHRAVPPLLELLDQTSGPLRYHVLAALAWLGDEAAVPALSRLVRDGEPTTRQLSARALAWTDAPGTVPLLMGVTRDPAVEVRIELLHAVERLTDPARADLLRALLSDPEGAVRAEAAWRLAALDPAGAGPALLPLLEDRDPLVRLAAADSLSRLGVTAAVPGLRKLVDRTRDEDERASYQLALDALGG